MPLSPFRPRPVPRKDSGTRAPPHPPPNTPVRAQSDVPRSILRPTPPFFMPAPYEAALQPRPPIATTTSYQQQHISSSRIRPYAQQRSSELSQTSNGPSHIHSSYIVPQSCVDQHDTIRRRSGSTPHVNPHIPPGLGRSTSDFRIAHISPLDHDSDRLARACGQPPSSVDRNHNSSRVKDPDAPDVSPSYPPLPKVRVGRMYRRLDTLARRSGRRAMDFVSFEDIATIHQRDDHFREKLRRKRHRLLEEKGANFHVLGASLEDVLLYASTSIAVDGYLYHLPTVVVACVEQLTKTGIYQSGLFRALPSHDRHVQLIDLFDNSPDFGAHFNMRGQTMPDVCALLSTFISSLPTPLLNPQIYSALWHWSVKPSAKREDERRDRQEEEDEERRARGESLRPNSWSRPHDPSVDVLDNALETDQISIAQILLRFLPVANLSLLVYLCGFFTQLPLCPENGLQLEDVARIFGPRLLGGSVKVVSQRMMTWLLTRWSHISETLFGETCGTSELTSPSSATQSRRPTVASEDTLDHKENRKGSEAGVTDESASSSHSLASNDSPKDHAGSSRTSSLDGKEREKTSTEPTSRHSKKRELHGQEPTSTERKLYRFLVSFWCLWAKWRIMPSKARRVHGHTHHDSGSRRHHAHALEHKNTPTSSGSLLRL